MNSFFGRHLSDAGQTYWQHFRTASAYAFALGRATLAVTLHAVLPFLFQTAASSIVARVHRQMLESRQRRA